MRYVAFALMGLASLYAYTTISAASGVYFRHRPVGARSQRRVTHRLAHATAYWECSVALVLIALQGWSALPNVIAIVGTAAIIWLTPALIDQPWRMR